MWRQHNTYQSFHCFQSGEKGSATVGCELGIRGVVGLSLYTCMRVHDVESAVPESSVICRSTGNVNGCSRSPTVRSVVYYRHLLVWVSGLLVAEPGFVENL